MYRPKGWENPYKKWGVPEDAYEAGADAMLEGLKKASVRHIISPSEISFWGVSTGVKTGYLVFIPEEE